MEIWNSGYKQSLNFPSGNVSEDFYCCNDGVFQSIYGSCAQNWFLAGSYQGQECHPVLALAKSHFFFLTCAAGTYLGQQAKWKLGVPSCFGAALLSVCVFSWLQFTMHSFIACFILIGTLVLSAFSWAKNSNGSVLLQTRLKQNLDLLCNVWICNKSSVSLKGVGMFFFPFFPICLLFKAVWEGKGVKRGNVRRGRKHTHTNKGRERVGSNSALRFLSPDENSRTSTGLGNCFLQFFLCQPSLPLLISHSLDHLGAVVPKSPRVALAPSEERFGVPIVPLGLAFSDRKSLTLYPGGGRGLWACPFRN